MTEKQFELWQQQMAIFEKQLSQINKRLDLLLWSTSVATNRSSVFSATDQQRLAIADKD
jgi:hypothetical protein